MRTNLLNDLSNVLKKGTSLREKGASLNLLPKMDRECIENDSRMDRQSLGKIFRYAAMITLLLTLACGNVWAGYESLNEGNMHYTFNNSDDRYYNYNKTDNGHTAVALGTLTGSFTITSASFQFSDDWADHPSNTPFLYLIYTYDNWSTKSDWQAYSYDYNWSTYWVYKNPWGYTIATNESPSGNFSLKYYWEAKWNDDTKKTINNNGSNYEFTYTILPPAVSDFTVSQTGALSGSGTADDPYIVPSGGTLQLDLSSASQAHSDANSSAQYSIDNSSWGTATSNTRKTLSNITSTSLQNWVVYAKYYNSTASLSGETKSKTIYYTAINIHEPGIYVSSGVGGYNKALTSYNNALYEWYGVYKTSSTNKILASQTSPSSNPTGANVVATFTSGTYSNAGWMLAKIKDNTSSSTSSAKDEFPVCSHAVQVDNATYFTFAVKGYSQVGILATDKNADRSKDKYLKVFIDGVDVTTSASASTSASARHYSIDSAQSHVVTLYTTSTDKSSIWGISLKPARPRISATSMAGYTYTQGDVANTMTVTASPVVAGHTLTYTWYSNTSATMSGATQVQSSTSSSYTPSTANVGGLYYVCVVSEEGCNTSTTPWSGLITVNASGYAVTYNNGGHGTAPSSTTATSVTLTDISTGDWINTGWKANVATTVGGETVAANTLIANGSTVTLSAATTFTAQWSECTGPTQTSFTSSGVTDGAHYTGDALGTLTVTAAATNGGSLSYLWKQYDDATGKNNAVDAAGTNNAATYSIPNNATCTNRHYFCIVTESGCSHTLESSISGALTLTEAPTLYTVTYNVNGGGTVTPASVTQASSGASVTLATPSWSGYTIEGWYNNKTKLANAGASYTPTANITAYAHWTDNISGKVFSFIDNNYGDKFKAFDLSGWVTDDATGKSKTYTNGDGVQYSVSAGCWDSKNNAISSLAKFKNGTSSMSVVIPAGKIATVKISYGAYSKDNKLTVGGENQTALSTALTDGMTNAQVYSALKEVTLNSQQGTLTLGSSTGNIYIGRVSAVITGYTVSYAAGTYGSGSLASGTKTHGSNFTLSSSDNAFTRDGYTYDGWSTNADGGTKDYELGGSYTTDAAITLYPHWVGAASISATLESDEYMRIGAAGMQLSISITGASSGWYYRVKNTDNNGYQQPDNTTYTTTSWTMTSTIGAATNHYVVELYDGSDNKMATSNTITVYGETGHPMTILAGANGSVSPSGLIYANGDHLHPEITATPSSGYHFVNWTKNNENATLANENAATTTITNASGACTITANFAADATLYTVTFNSNGGSAVSPITQASEDASIAKPSDPTRASYEFDGWYATAGEKISWPYTPEADITLYARWQEACDAGSGEEGSTKIIGFTTATCSEKASTGGERTLSNVSNLTVAHEIHDGGDGDDSLMVNTEAKVAMYYGSNSKVYSRGAYRWIKGLSSLGKSNNTVGFSTTVASGYQFTIDSISFGIGASANFTYQIIIYQSGDTLYKSPIRTVTNYNSSSSTNHEFHVNGLSAQTKLQNLTGTFYVRVRVCQSNTGKYFYLPVFQVIGNLHESGGGGGGIGTCYHVYYKGNGADEGFVADTTSYADGEEVTVLDYDDSRYPLAKDGYEFRGWATSAGGSVAYSAGDKITIDGADVTLHAVWVAESDALVTWKMKTADNEAWATTTGTGTTDETNITSISTDHDEGDNKAKNPATAKTALASSASNVDKGADFTFAIGSTKQVEINKLDCQVFNVGGDNDGQTTYKAQISDAAGNVYTSTNSVCPANDATLTDASFVFGSGKILRGAVTIRVYGWVSGSGSWTDFRMGPDVKFYGTVQDYACATPSAPTISGVSEYVPGQTITLTASHDGENYDNLTTYTWYKGDTWGSKSKVQNAATGSAGYTFTKASCAAGDAGKYWCEVSNGAGCDAHNSEGYDVTVYPTYTITYNLNGGDWGEVEYKTSYTQFDEDYTLPTPTKTGSVFAGWYGASDFSGLPTVVLGAGSVGNKEYWAKWGETVTVSWTVTKVDDELYRGGGGYSVKAVINETDWSTGFMDELELTATEGVTLKNIEVSENGESKVQVTADFDITTDLAADATSITFTLDVPADGTYGPKVDEHEEDLDDCGGSGSDAIISIFKGTSDGDNTNTDDAVKYKQNSKWTDAITGFASTAKGVKDALYVFGDNSWSSSNVKVSGTTYVRGIQNGGSDASKNHFKIEIPTGSTATIYLVAGRAGGSANFGLNKSAIAPQSGTHADKVWYASYGSSKVLQGWTIEDVPSGTYYLVGNAGDCIYAELKVTLTSEDGGITPTLTWETDLSGGVSKRTSDDDFIHTASQNKNSLGAITYSSNNTAVATVNSTTGQVHLVGAAGTATITATIAASGCFSSANVSYTITVTDDCDDEAGTIATEDLGCSGVKMTVTGHTAAAGVIYQWYKVGTPSDATVGTNQDNFTATEAGSYYVIVTNTGDRHCAKRSTNTITVEAQAAATVTKIVDSWYVKKDRRTPDIELVKTTNATSFTVTSGSITIWESAGSIKTGFAGCGFHMGENGIIYLNGTKDNGDAPAHDDGTWAAGDETLTITAIGCGGNASQNITIHKQAATNYKEIAFVADGGKGMRKDSITVGHGDGTELYEYLDTVGTAAGKRLFQLSERNIYWTTDEKAIREEYSRFDAILITDDPSTNTVVKKGDDYKTKGYVNAFGTMVDVRPIFTMEAYVSALKNWGSKGIAGNPQSPNPRQYEMRLECKDHEIYGAGLPDPDDGTNVWEEVIGGETFRHVILVDSTKGIYNGVAYNAQTAGNEKPALQGFTGEAAGSLLGLGRILEGTLQAAIERQKEPAARLLVMGINAKALQPTCALTNEGKTVIKNILVYLLKTNMEEVDDCSNYFTGKTDSDWNKTTNWSKSSLPNYETRVRILAPCEVSGVTAHVAQVDIVSSGESSIRANATGLANCNGKLTINANGALIVEGKVRAADAPHFAANDLKPTTVNDLVLNTSSANQAALIFNNDEGKTQATVNLYSLGRKVSETNQFQYFAIPMSYLSVNPTFANETHGITIYTYVWLEATGWDRRGYYTDLYAFEGIGITTDKTDAHVYTMKGTLASTKDQEIPITADGKKLNLIGNSWTAPIQISELEASDFGDASSTVEQTVYIYCAGYGNSTADGKTEAAGQWLAIPFEATRFDAWDGLKVIPSMQAFQIKTKGEGTLTLDYDKHVRGGSTDLTAKLRTPQRRAAHDGVELMRIRVADSKTHTDLYLFEGDQFSDAFDNGWEANYRVGTNESAKLYARVATGVMSVAAMSDLEGTPIYFIPGQETEYTFTFGGNGMGYYLNDLKLQQSTLISEGAEYSFTYEKGDAAARFMISATPYESPQVTTGTENVQTEDKPRKILYNNKLYIIYNGHVYSADGAIVK